MSGRRRASSEGMPSGTRGGAAGSECGRAKLRLQRAGRLVQQQAERVDVLGFLLFQRRYLGADALDLGGRVLDIQAILQAALLAFLRKPEHVAINLEIVIGDPDLGLDAAQLDVVARQFREARDQRVAALIGGLIDRGVGGFDLPADLAPQVQFPGCIEADIVVVDRADIGRGLPGGTSSAQQADDAVLAVQLAGIFRIAVDRREFRGGRDAALKPALGQPDRCGPHVEIGGGDATLEIGQDRIAKHRPPRRIRWRRQSRIGTAAPLSPVNDVSGKCGSGDTKFGPTEQPAASNGAISAATIRLLPRDAINALLPGGRRRFSATSENRSGTIRNATIAQ